MKSIAKKIPLAVLCLFWIIWLISIFKCEIQTRIHYDEFAKGYELTRMVDDNDYFKVIKYDIDSKYAQVYYVAKRDVGITIDFKLVDSQWEISEWNAVWSGSGSAEGSIWPYFLDSILNGAGI